MVLARLLVGLLLFAAILCLALFAATGQARWRRLGLAIVKWTVVAALGFFAMLFLERVVALL